MLPVSHLHLGASTKADPSGKPYLSHARELSSVERLEFVHSFLGN